MNHEIHKTHENLFSKIKVMHFRKQFLKYKKRGVGLKLALLVNFSSYLQVNIERFVL